MKGSNLGPSTPTRPKRDANGDIIVGVRSYAVDNTKCVEEWVDHLINAVGAGSPDKPASYSFTMTPVEGGTTVQIAASEPLINVWREDANLCDMCHHSPCAWVEHYDAIIAYSSHLEEEGRSNREIRYLMYAFTTRMIHGVLGLKNRMQAYDCVSAEIHDHWPKKANETYTGFKEA